MYTNRLCLCVCTVSGDSLAIPAPPAATVPVEREPAPEHRADAPSEASEEDRLIVIQDDVGELDLDGECTSIMYWPYMFKTTAIVYVYI